MRVNLKIFRIKQHLTQVEMSDRIGCSRATYSAVECGARMGRQTFWQDLQKAFNLPDAEMWELTKND